MESNLRPVGWLCEVFPGLSREGAYRFCRTTPTVTVRLGRKVYVRRDRIEELIDAGGKALPGGWRREVERVEL